MSKSSSTLPAGSSPTAAAPALLARHEPALRAYLSALQGATSEQVQAALVELRQEAMTAPGFEDDPAVWLFTQGRRRIVGSGHRGDVLVPDEPEGSREDEAQTTEDPAVVAHRAFSRLTNKQQEVLRLKFQFHFNLEELARITGVSGTGATGLLHAAMERLCRASGATLTLGSGRGGDVRLTAYALDELEPPQKQAFAESVPDAKALLESSDAIRKVGAQLTRILESGAPVAKRRRRPAAAWWKSPLALVALPVIAGLGVAIWYFMRPTPARQRVGEATSLVLKGDSPSVGRASDEAGKTGHGAPGVLPADISGRLGRDPRPGEAAWERKAFGRGHAGANLAAGEGSAGASASGGNAAEGEGESGPLSTAGGEHSPGSASGLSSGHDPLAEKRGENEMSDAAKDKAAPAKEDAKEVAQKPIAENPAEVGKPASSAAKPASGGSMKSAQQPQAKKTDDAPGTPKEAGTIPPKEPQLAGLVPMQRELATTRRPKPNAIKVAEMVKQAPLERPPEAASEPLATRLDVTRSPWKPEKLIARATAKARPSRPPTRPAASLVFAIDVSGSMAGPNRLPLVREGIRLLADRLRPEDRVAVVTYAAQAKEILPGNPLGEKALALRNCLAGLEASGQTNGGEGLQVAYDTARKNRVESGLNVVILCTDGNFNLGETGENALAAIATQAANEGIKLSVFGFGRSDRNDLRLELLATSGGGRSCYVNTTEEAERLLAGQIDGLVETVAKDVVLEVTFDAARVAGAVRIDGAAVASNDARVGELLSGRTLAALYEISLKPRAKEEGALARLALEYQLPGSAVAGYQQKTFDNVVRDWAQLEPSFRFAIAWAEFGRILREGGPTRSDELDRVEEWVQRYLPEDTGGYRQELLENVAMARLAVD